MISVTDNTHCYSISSQMRGPSQAKILIPRSRQGVARRGGRFSRRDGVLYPRRDGVGAVQHIAQSGVDHAAGAQ